jgi:hypothetical protein
LSNKKSKGDDEMMERQERQHRTAIQEETSFPAQQKWIECSDLAQIISLPLVKDQANF